MPASTPAPDPNELVQMNVRVPRALRDQIDQRRAVKKLSRDRWVRNALAYALAAKPQTRPVTGAAGRTAPPPRHRPQP